MKRYFKITAVGLAVIAALALTVSKRGPAMMIGIGRTTGAASVERKAYDLNNSLNTFNQTLGRILEAYVDPTRLDPKQMLLAALDSIQKQVAEVMVEPFPEQNRIVVHVDTAIREFRIDQVDSPWAMSPKMQEIFQFITQHLLPGTDAEALRNIEYAATNGMLSTLDPHSLLLDPQTYNEMKTSTSGRFGGLGIVIGIRKNSLTVIRPMKDTPAWEAGVRKGDRITRIEKDLTQNMALTDAVSRLRGDPGSKVEVWFERDGDKSPRRLVLTRAEIHVHSVTSHVLPSPSGNIGYIRLSQFSQKSDEDLRNALEDLTRKQSIRGLILAPTSATDNKHIVALAREVPVVLIDRVAKSVRCDSVVVDNEGGAHEAIDYLVANGHRRIGLLRDDSRIFTAQERLAGYQNSLQSHGIALDEALISVSRSTVEQAIEATIRLFNQRNRPTALFTVDSLMTQGALLALRSMGLSIPNDVSLIGFDDFNLATFTDPQITVVAQPISEIGPLAAKLLLERLEGKKGAPREIRFPTRLIVRGSVARAKKR